MLSLVCYLRDRLSYLRDQRGIESLEWILIGAIVTGVAVATFNLFNGSLDIAVTAIATFITNQLP